MRRATASLTIASACVLVCTLAASGWAHGWTALKNQPPVTASTMLLLMDGRVLLHGDFSNKWYILTPDASGSYVNGTWKKAASSHYDRLYYASGVLADGRVIVAGGEYSTNGGDSKVEIYDPVANKWSDVPSPTGWSYIGDAPSVVLADGRFMLGSIVDGHTAIYDPATNSWTAADDKLNGNSVEETFTLMPDATVLTAECINHPGSELYDTANDAWVDLGAMPVDLVDGGLEIGGALFMYDGLAFCLGATPHSARYAPASTPGGIGTWTKAADPPPVGGNPVSATDAPMSILPNGNVLCAVGLGFSGPTYFFEYDGTAFNRVPDAPNNSGPPYTGRMIILPSGKVLFAAGSVYMYTCDGGPSSDWQPTITSVATDLIPGETYVLKGTQLNGLSTGVSYGDDAMSATNYPIVRLRYVNTNHLTYCRSFKPSTMGYATGSAEVSTHFIVPATAETGPANLEVVANGISSTGVSVEVRDPITIDFDALASGVVVTNQFAEATFSSEPGFENWTDAQNKGSSQPNVICTGPAGGGIDCVHDTYVDFPCAVASLTFRGVGVDGTGAMATVNVYERGLFSSAVTVDGVGDPTVPVRVDLTAFHDVTRIEIVGIADSGGIAWDDFRFCLGSSAGWSNYGTGFPGTNGIPAFTCEQNPVLGTTMTTDLDNSSGVASVAVILVGDQQASIPTSKGGDLLVVPLLSVPLPIGVGVNTIDADIPSDPAYCGAQIFAQALELDAGAAHKLSFTAGLELLLGY